MSVLLVRPKHKLASSCANFIAHGIPTTGMAVIETVPDTQALNTLMEQLPAHFIAVFTSTVSAQIALTLSELPPVLSQNHCFAVGMSTATVLRSHNVNVACPALETSEGLLALPALSGDLTGQNVVIFKGYEGRKTLAQSLSERGAAVKELPLYQRKQLHSPYINGLWQPEQIQCIIVTSAEQAAILAGQIHSDRLKTVPWIVVSQRIADSVASLGVTNTIISGGADDASLITCVKQVLEQ